MGCYYTLCHNTYAYSLLFYKVHIKRENAGNWNSGWKRSKYWKPILHSSKNPETPRKSLLELIRIIERRKYQRGPTPWPGGWGRPPLLGALPISWAPWWPSGAHLLLYEGFYPNKIISKLMGQNSAATRRNQSRAPAELLCRENFPLGGENHHHHHHQRSSHREGVNLHQHLHQHHLLSKP